MQRLYRSSCDSPLEGDGFEPVWGFSCQVVIFGLLRVLCSEVCPGKASMFSRRQSCRGKSQSPVVRIAEEMETEPSKPIDKISPEGRTRVTGLYQKRTHCGLEKSSPEGRA